MHHQLGEHLLCLAREARRQAVFAAPFVKLRALTRILEELAPQVRLEVVTRWAPEEVAAGISDIEIWRLIQQRPQSQLRTLPRLHAKYFRFDDIASVGSANITGRALGWSTQSNLELMVDIPSSSVSDFEHRLRSESFVVDDDAYQAMKAASKLVEGRRLPSDTFDVDEMQSPPWFPRSLQVHQLWSCYRGRSDLVIESVYVDGLADLQALQVPPGLGQSEFNGFISARLQQVPIVSAIDYASSIALERAAGAELLVHEGLFSEAQSLDAWDRISAWMLHFFPNRYRLKNTFTGPALEQSQRL